MTHDTTCMLGISSGGVFLVASACPPRILESLIHPVLQDVGVFASWQQEFR